MNLLKSSKNGMKGFNATLDKDDLADLQKMASKFNLDVRDLIRAGAKLVLKVKERKRVILILTKEKK